MPGYNSPLPAPVPGKRTDEPEAVVRANRGQAIVAVAAWVNRYADYGYACFLEYNVAIAASVCGSAVFHTPEVANTRQPEPDTHSRLTGEDCKAPCV